ncbi:hypothetical protein ART_3615 [Arthrobacter sp. PAMC 25486]|uniref:ABC transporter substrate-binding protein n=1 Tax=Arthrobacter sp. PAMC 25486 TaxID=1494608 RepID=UPI000535F4EB|nr:ABC transporter substrate-binding protein [Arthrobacter sp. PAMC 25486]AIY03214.1 hypothetical protein ART_3615 [Arthrobacter sp. PAMC 25486]
MKAPNRAVRALALAATAAIFLTGCGSSAEPGSDGAAAKAVTTLTLASGVEPQSLDPAMSREAQFVQYFQPVFDTLIRRNSDGEPVPMLAAKWETAKDGKSLTLTLRDDVTFTDGAKLDAEAVKGNLERFKEAGGPLTAALAAVESVDAVDATTVKLNLSTPDPALVYALGGPSGYMQSPANFDSPTVDTQPIGSGPYELDRAATTPGSQYTFVKNDDYWDTDLQKFEKLVIKPIKDENARFNAVRSGQADGMIATAKTVKAAEAADVTVKMVPGDWQGLTLLDRAGELTPELGKVEVRQAINYAIDKDAILKNVAQGLGTVTSQVFGPSSVAFVADLDSAYGYDVDKAKALLKTAGLESGFTLKMPTSSDMDPALAPAIKDQLAKVGITVDWVDVPSAQYQPEQQSGSYSALFTAFGQPVVAWTAINTMVTESAPWNVFKSSTPETKVLLADILAGSDEEAAAKQQELNEYLVDNAWFAPWYRIDQPYFISKNVSVTVQNGQPVPSIYNFEPAK